MADHCRDFSRSQLLRNSVATAGAGLPAIEPGMPLPAGTGLSRRSFLLRSAGLAMSVYGAGQLLPGALEAGVANAAVQGADDRVLVSVFLNGGADSLSLLAPVADPYYSARRPTLAVSPDNRSFGEDDRLVWHPAAGALATLHAEGKVSVMPGVGYAHPNQSHFTSRHFWEVGELETRARTGWLGRYLDQNGTPENPLQGLSLAPSLAPSLATAVNPVAAVGRPDDYQWYAHGVAPPLIEPMLRAFQSIGKKPSASPALAQARRGAAHSIDLLERIVGFSAGAAPVSYPSGNSFPQRLAWLAEMLGQNLPLRCVALMGAGSYDTHANQAGGFNEGIAMTFDSLLAFQRDLEARGIADRVLVHVWSEFGRRVYENGSQGTDHGAAGIGFVIGSRAKGTMVGEFPGVRDSDIDQDGNLRATVDFRAVYCSLLEQWLQTDAGPIIPGADTFDRPVLVES